MAVFDEKWQQAKSTIKERGIFVFNNELLSDVSLIVRASTDEGASKKSKMAIPAHKMVLSVSSPVFFAMFCGELAEKSNSVDLPDCEYEAVLEMLRYMYSEEVNLSESNVMQVLYVAKKYILPSLAEECIKFLQENLNTENVFTVMPYAQIYDEKTLLDQCWNVIDQETEQVVKTEGFVTIERSLLEQIIKRDLLTIREIELFKAVDLWATKECERQGLTADGYVKRRILGEKIIKEIRFPVMEQKEFITVVLGCKILTSDEGIDIMKHFNSVMNSPVGFQTKERAGTFLVCNRFTEIDVDHLYHRVVTGWLYEGIYSSEKKECIDLKVDKNIKLHGIRMFGLEDHNHVVILKITDSRLNSNIFASKSGTFSSVAIWFESLFYYGFDVMFDSPVELKSGVRYSVKAIIDGHKTSANAKCLNNVDYHGVKFSFFESNEKDCIHFNARCGHFAAFLFRS